MLLLVEVRSLKQALFIAIKIIDFKIGGVAITEQLFHSGTVAVLMGVLCGISEPPPRGCRLQTFRRRDRRVECAGEN